MSNLGYYPNTFQFWQEFINIVNETDHHFNEYLDIDEPSPELSRWIAELFINNAQRMLELPAASVNPEVLNLVDQFVECYHAFSNYYYEVANWCEKRDTYEQEYNDLDNPFSYVGHIFENFIGTLSGRQNAFHYYDSTINRLVNDQNAITQKAEELYSNATRLLNYYRLLLSRTNQLRDRLFS